MYIIHNKFITFLSYFDHDRKYPDSRIVVDATVATQRSIAMSTNYGQHCELSNFGQKTCNICSLLWIAGLCTADSKKNHGA